MEKVESVASVRNREPILKELQKMSIEKKIKLSFKFTLACSIVITILFMVSYIIKKSEYLNNINKEIEGYNKKIGYPPKP